MSLFFMLLDGRMFHEQLVPALAASWRQRQFAPCRALCRRLLPEAEAFRESFFSGVHEPLLARVLRELPFDRSIWRALVGELLLVAAAEVPEIQTAPEALCCLLAPERYGEEATPRERLAPIQQAHLGTRDLTFGGAFYRPEQAGLNHLDDTARLADYLAAIDPQRWTVAALAALRDAADEEERTEELGFVRDWFPALQEMYRRARERRQVVVCELL
jgi:hypothetical protein